MTRGGGAREPPQLFTQFMHITIVSVSQKDGFVNYNTSLNYLWYDEAKYVRNYERPMTQETATKTFLLQGRYTITQRLGTGRLAAVYRGYDERLQRPVLIHLFRKDLLDREALQQRFIAESQAMARVSHRSLLEVYDTGALAQQPFMVTEFVEGRTLRELGAVSLEEALLYIRQIAGAVAACETASVAAPPISSANVVLVADGHVELLEHWQTPATDVARDLARYRAPERTPGSQLTPPAAVYALGLLLLELLIGRPVVDGDDARTIAQTHATAVLPTLADVIPRIVLPDLAQFVQRATARDPQRRQPNATVFLDELDELRRRFTRDTRRLAAPPVRPPTPRQQMREVSEQVQRLPERGRERLTQVRQQAVVSGQRLRKRPVTGIIVLLGLFLTVGCGAYFTITALLPSIFGGRTPAIGQQPGVPGWFVGVPDGPGPVLVISIADVGGLNLRTAPKSDPGNVLLTLPSGTRVRQMGDPVQADGINWIPIRAQIKDQQVDGWVSATYTRRE